MRRVAVFGAIVYIDCAVDAAQQTCDCTYDDDMTNCSIAFASTAATANNEHNESENRHISQVKIIVPFTACVMFDPALCLGGVLVFPSLIGVQFEARNSARTNTHGRRHVRCGKLGKDCRALRGHDLLQNGKCTVWRIEARQGMLSPDVIHVLKAVTCDECLACVL